MNKFVISILALCTAFISSHGHGQEIDSSLIQNLSSEQITMAKEALNKALAEALFIDLGKP